MTTYTKKLPSGMRRLKGPSLFGRGVDGGCMMRKQFTWILSYAIFICTLLGYVIYEHGPQRHLLQLSPSQLIYDINDEEPLDEEQTCRVPILDPYDKSILAYISNSKPIVCRVRQEAFTYIDDMGRMRLNKTAFIVSGYTPESLWCYYQSIKRVNNSDVDVEFGPTKVVVDAEDITDEFISVWCKNFLRITIYANMHAQVVPIARFFEDANAKDHGTSQTKDSSEMSPPERNTRKPSVLIFVVDSMSRLNFIRQLPLTYTQLVRSMGSVVLRGFTKVGDNTFPNLVPLLTGKRPFLDFPTLEEGETYDNWPCLWKNFSSKGYATMLAEDTPHLALFNYKDAGFRMQPTDHYLRPFWLALDASIEHKLSSNLCYGAIPKHRYQLSYVSQFVKKYNNVPYLAISFMTELSHDYLNQVGAADADFASFFHSLHGGGYLNDTVMVVMGDHGFRFGFIRLTAVGRVEDKMPFASVFIPHELRTRYPHAMDALKRNSKRLTSVFDLHRTIMDLLGDDTSDNVDAVKNRTERGVSLFSEVSARRTCEQAGVPDEFCTCEDEQSLVLENPLVTVAAGALTNSLNEKTMEYRSMCAVLTLKHIRDAAIVVPDASAARRNYSGQVDSADLDPKSKIRVTIEVGPSGGLFEGTVAFHGTSNITVLPDISRLNLYGRQASCVVGKILAKNPDLTKFCYCTT